MKKAYLLLMLGVFALLIVSAFLTHSLVNMAVPEEVPQISIATTKGADARISSVSKMQIEVKEPRPFPDMTPDNWRIRADSLKPEIPSQAVSALDGVGEVTHARGNTYITAPDKSRGTLAVNTRIPLNSQVETGSESFLQIRFNDGSTVSLSDNSVLTVDEYVYDPASAGNNRMIMRFVKGTCRVFTGAITELNPKGFMVRSRMASIGIRGCELALSADATQEHLYVLDVSDGKEIVVETTSNGSPVMNLLTGEDFHLDKSVKQTIVVAESGQLILLKNRREPQQRPATPQEVRQINEQTSLETPVRYNIHHERGGIKFQLLEPAPEEKSDSGKNK